MIKLAKAAIAAGLLTAVAGSAYAQQTMPTQPTYQTAPQTSYLPASQEPKPSGNNYISPEHFEKPAGYDQNPWNYPYGPGHGPRPN